MVHGIIITSIVMVLAILFLGTANHGFSQNRGGFLLYNNTDYDFQILYPQDWRIIEGDTSPGDYVTEVAVLEPSDEQGVHNSKKFPCGEVCLFIQLDNSLIRTSSLQQYSDDIYNNFKKAKGFKLLDYNPVSRLGDKKAFEIFFQSKQGNREYISKLFGVSYPPKNIDESKNFLTFQFKTRDKFAEQTLPLMKTMIDSFQFHNTTQSLR